MLSERERRMAREAADEIERCGWWQKSACGPNGQVCVTEALYRKMGPLATFTNYWNICEAITGIRGGLVVWNDRSDQTMEKVVAKLREVGAK